MDSYYFDREDALYEMYEMYEDAMNTFEDEDQEEDDEPSLSASDRNPSLT